MTPVRPPKQRRSQETLDRFVRAARRLLDEKSFDKITVSDIVQEAGSSVGAFYARFKNKDALLEHLRAVSSSAARADGDRRRSSRDWDAAPIEVVSLELVRELVRYYRNNSGTLRALSARSIADGRPAFVVDGAETPPHLAIVDIIRRRRAEIAHPNPDVAVHLGLRMVESAIRERVLFPELSAGPSPLTPITDAVFVEELTRAFVGFLGLNRTGP